MKVYTKKREGLIFYRDRHLCIFVSCFENSFFRMMNHSSFLLQSHEGHFLKYKNDNPRFFVSSQKEPF